MPNRPEIIVFAGPNGSGKSTIAKMAKIIDPYINADDIKRVNLCSDLDAAQMADKIRIQFVNEHKSFTFETVLSTDRNLNLLKKSKQEGFFIRCIYVLTADVNINVLRVKTRKESGGHDVPIEKIFSRYTKALHLVPELIEVCDVCQIYDNSNDPFRIFKKRKTEFFYWENEFWDKEKIKKLTNIEL